MDLQTTIYTSNIERIESLIAELAKENLKSQKEAEQRQKEAEQRQKETEQRQKEAEQRQKEADLRSQKLERKLERMSELYDGFAKNTGEAVESFFYEYFLENPVIKDIHFKKVVQQMRTDDAEFDIVLTNGDYVAVIEVKHKFHPKDALKFIEKMLPKFKTEFPKFAHCKIIAGVASYIFPEDTKKIALENGLYIFTQAGENVKIANPRGFKPVFY